MSGFPKEGKLAEEPPHIMEPELETDRCIVLLDAMSPNELEPCRTPYRPGEFPTSLWYDFEV
jgi:hypothetical protein